MTAHLAQLITAADPLAGADAPLIPVAAQLEDLFAVVDRAPDKAPGPRRRNARLLVAAGAVAVAAAVAVPLLAPSGTPGSATDADARALSQLAAVVRASGTVSPTVTTIRETLLDVVDTTRGPAYYWQTITTTSALHATSADYDYDYGVPHYVTAADRERAQHRKDPHGAPYVGAQTHHDDQCGLNCQVLPPDVVTVLDHVPAADLNKTLVAERDRIGGCVAGPDCEVENLLELLRAPAIPATLRASAIQALSSSAGITVVGHQVVNGQSGLAIRDDLVPGSSITYVLDETDGQVLRTTQRVTAAGRANFGDRVPAGTVVDDSQVLR